MNRKRKRPTPNQEIVSSLNNINQRLAKMHNDISALQKEVKVSLFYTISYT